ncbi:MAG TPA: FAD-binding oxidoreductase [Vicinamibacterales bacterium]|nr:FAD-binding oxidoreductase [Vicinamibacterales bacterium]
MSPGEMDRYLSDAAHFPGGHAAAVAIPHTAGEVPPIVRAAAAILPVGAQSSLTGGATPMGETVLSTEKLTHIRSASPGRIVVEAGVAVVTLQETLAGLDAWFPPAPTFTGASAGGVVATNAAGAATFKYGAVRSWVEAIEVVLADGTPLSLRRGDCVADGYHLRLDAGRVIDVPVPRYRMPDVVKRSAGYHAEPGMDGVDLFIGSEGTLGILTAVTFRTATPRPLTAMALIPCRSEPQALALVGALRTASFATWRAADPDGIDVAAIEHMDRRCLDILREDGSDRQNDVALPAASTIVLLVQIELPPGTTDAAAFEQIAGALTATRDGPLVRFCRLLHAHGALDEAEMSLPGQARRAAQFVALREAVPAGVNRRVGAAQRDLDPRIAKTAADMIVPFERFAEMMAIYRDGFAARGLDAAVWGHVSDGNVHPNVLPRSYADVEAGKAAILAFGRDVARLGGCPLAEHGVGRHAVKQTLLRELYGAAGIDEMRAVKRALDPSWRLAPGVIFPR